MSLDSIENAIEDIHDGKMIIVVDEEDRENEGDLTMAAERVTPDSINFMATHGRGLICMAMTPERLDRLEIPLMVSRNESMYETAFCVSIEGRRNVSTGISAADRATTILTAIDPRTRPEDLIRPGHVFPLRARPGGVLERAGQTEAAVDLARIAGLDPAGVICEIMNEDGTMARLPDLQRFAARHGIKIVSVVDLMKFRLRTERFVKRIQETPFECEQGRFQLVLYENELDGNRHVVLTKGRVNTDEPVLVRVHSALLLGDVFSGLKHDSGRELRKALELIQAEGRGVLVYLRYTDKEDRLLREITGEIQYPANFRDYGVGAQILADLGLRNIRVLTNHPKKIVGLEGFKLNVVEQLSIPVRRTGSRQREMRGARSED
ncbi:MAG: 3,4-dihydroxy-2-butanone-4-phosphate synthase [Candidatus Aminicenantes bacterium]|nr:3,4-dihydroxy-2-butanone-4-phosphate synthase [Candidatus Aminicenantes bacterium]